MHFYTIFNISLSCAAYPRVKALFLKRNASYFPVAFSHFPTTPLCAAQPHASQEHRPGAVARLLATPDSSQHAKEMVACSPLLCFRYSYPPIPISLSPPTRVEKIFARFGKIRIFQPLINGISASSSLSYLVGWINFQVFTYTLLDTSLQKFESGMKRMCLWKTVPRVSIWIMYTVRTRRISVTWFLFIQYCRNMFVFPFYPCSDILCSLTIFFS